MKEIIINYHKLPIGNIPFHEIPSLEAFDYDYVYCSSMSIKEFMGIGSFLITVFNAFIKGDENTQNFIPQEPLFGKVISAKLPTRGKARCINLSTHSIFVSTDDLPDFKYIPDISSKDRCFYLTKGNYIILAGIKSTYEKIKHLEESAIYGDFLIRLRIVIELLKKNVKKGIVKLSEDEYKEIAFKVLKNDPALSKTDNLQIINGVNNWVTSMLLVPLYEDIPEDFRGKVKK